MKTSEAMLKGMDLYPNYEQLLVKIINSDHQPDGACALGFVLLGRGYSRDEILGMECDELLQTECAAQISCPVKDCHNRDIMLSVACIIPHLNDHHQWSVKDIASWLQDLGF